MHAPRAVHAAVTASASRAYAVAVGMWPPNAATYTGGPCVLPVAAVRAAGRAVAQLGPAAPIAKAAALAGEAAGTAHGAMEAPADEAAGAQVAGTAAGAKLNAKPPAAGAGATL